MVFVIVLMFEVDKNMFDMFIKCFYCLFRCVFILCEYSFVKLFIYKWSWILFIIEILNIKNNIVIIKMVLDKVSIIFEIWGIKNMMLIYIYI